MLKRGVLAIMIVGLALITTACAFFDDAAGLFGFDHYDYMGENIIGSVETDSEVAEKIKDMIFCLSVDSIILPEFDDMKTALDACRDSVLNYMLNKNYARYAGNSDLIKDACELYPEYTITQLIPAADFEATAYEYFGGSVKISHGDGEIFKYLSKAACYIPAVAPISDCYDVEIEAIDETESAYRVTFNCSVGDASARYFASVIKREDNTLYFKSLHKR